MKTLEETTAELQVGELYVLNLVPTRSVSAISFTLVSLHVVESYTTGDGCVKILEDYKGSPKYYHINRYQSETGLYLGSRRQNTVSPETLQLFLVAREKVVIGITPLMLSNYFLVKSLSI